MARSMSRRDLAVKIRDAYKDGGCRTVAAMSCARLSNLLLRRNAALWYGRELQSPLPLKRTDVPGTFASIEPEELARWLLASEEVAWAADPRELEIASQLEHVWTCWRVCGEIAGFCKIGHARVFVVDFEREVPLPERLSLLSDVYVLEEMRRKGIARELLIATMEVLRRSSFAAMGCHIPQDNRASIRLFESLGFHSFGEIRFTRVLGVPFFSVRPESVLERIADPAGYVRMAESDNV
jgi:ribosomal protein S18 acetylase RimI-like enzyme